MKKLCLTFAVLLVVTILFSGISFTQEVNFSGKWKLNNEKSKFPQMGDRGGRRGGGPRGGDQTYTIEHEKDKITITQLRVSQRGDRESVFTFTTDGKECTNVISMMRMEAESVGTCKWDGDKLVIKSEMEYPSRDGGTMTRNSTEEYSLSEDGKVLTIISKRESRGEPRTTTMVFDKIIPPPKK